MPSVQHKIGDVKTGKPARPKAPLAEVFHELSCSLMEPRKIGQVFEVVVIVDVKDMLQVRLRFFRERGVSGVLEDGARSVGAEVQDVDSGGGAGSSGESVWESWESVLASERSEGSRELP